MFGLDVVTTTFKRDGWRITAESDGPHHAIGPRAESMTGYERVESSANTEVFRFQFGGRGYYCKTYTHVSWDRRIKDFFRGVWSKRTVRVHGRLTEAGFSVPTVVCHGRRGFRGVIVFEEASGRDLPDLLYDLSHEQLKTLFARFGHCVGRLHRCGFMHGDLHIGNVIVEDPSDPDFVLLDNERTKTFPALPWLFRRKNLVQILFSLAFHHPQFGQYWDDFYKSYCFEIGVSSDKSRKWEQAVKTRVQRQIAIRTRQERRSSDGDR